MIRASQPCRQLNSEAIKGNALCFLSSVVSGTCSIVTANCVCNAKEKALKRSWETICTTRDACDKPFQVGIFQIDIDLFKLE